MRKRIALGAVVLLVAGVMASLPANAEPKEGWFVFLEGINTQVLDTAQPTGTVVTFGDPLAGGAPDKFDHQFVDWGTTVNGRIGFGKQWANGNKLTVSYWAYDNDEDGTRDLSTVNGFYSPFGYYYYYTAPAPAHGRAPSGLGGTFFTFSRFDANVKASSIDVDFGHVHSVTDHFDFEWNLGMKFASYEDTNTVESGYTYTYTDGTQYNYFYREKMHTESDMWGFKAGARGTYNFGERFSLTAGLNLSKLMGDVESTTSLGVETPGFATTFFEDVAQDDNRSGTIADYDIMGMMHIGEHFDVGIGYEHSTWQGISKDLMREHWDFPSRDEVGFAGWKIAVKYRFGGG
jgi:hypothetical protein